MAEIIQDEGGGGKKKGKRRAKKYSAHIDMTPMVDLACLLLTFFMLTTAFSKPKIMEIAMPLKDPNAKPPPIAENRAITIILAENDQVFYYFGLADPTKGYLPPMIKSNYGKDGIRKMLLARNKKLFEQIYYLNDSITKGLGNYKANMPPDSIEKKIKLFRKQDETGPIVLIKSAEKATYGNMVDIIDEMAITNSPRYAIVDMNYVDEKMLKDALAGKNTELQN